MRNTSPSIESVRTFWENNPVASSAVSHPLGTPEYFRYYDTLREANEGVEFSYALHEYKAFADRQVLDVGCGNGYVLSRYAREGSRVFGVALTETSIALCRKRFALSGLQGEFAVGSVEDLPFPDQSFDLVCSMGVLHHTPDTAQAVREVFRVLKPGWRLILMFYHRGSLKYRWNLMLRRLLTLKSTQQLVNEADGVGDPKSDVYSENELRGLLSQFERVEVFAGLFRGTHLVPAIAGSFHPGSSGRSKNTGGGFCMPRGTSRLRML